MGQYSLTVKNRGLIHFSLGSTDGRIHCWNTETGLKLAVLGGDHTGPVQCVQFNPKYMMLATACTSMVSYISRGAVLLTVRSSFLSAKVTI